MKSKTPSPPELYNFIGHNRPVGRDSEMDGFIVLACPAFGERHKLLYQIEPQKGLAPYEIDLQAPCIHTRKNQPANRVPCGLQRHFFSVFFLEAVIAGKITPDRKVEVHCSYGRPCNWK
jgi:hypothetical protein